MSDLRRRRYNTFIRVKAFGDGNATDFPLNSTGNFNFTEISEAISMMEQGGITQVSGASKQTTANKATARGELKEMLSTIARTAKALAVDDDKISELFRTSSARNEQTILATARAFLASATPLQAKFVEYGLSENFITDLDEAINTFAETISEQGNTKNNQVGATALADQGMEKGMKALRRLNAIVPNKYANNPTKLAEWTTASHIEKADKTKETTDGETTPDEENPS